MANRPDNQTMNDSIRVANQIYSAPTVRNPVRKVNLFDENQPEGQDTATYVRLTFVPFYHNNGVYDALPANDKRDYENAQAMFNRWGATHIKSYNPRDIRGRAVCGHMNWMRGK